MNPITQRSIEDADRDLVLDADIAQIADQEQEGGSSRGVMLRLLWAERLRLRKAALVGLVIGLIIAILIPNSYDATVQLMPPDSSALSGGAALLGMMMGQSDSSIGGGSSGVSGLAGTVSDLLGSQRPGQVFIGVLSSRTVADAIINRFDLRKVYWHKTYERTRKDLGSNSDFSEGKKTGIISITVSDHDPERARAIAQAYVDELNQLLSQVNNSAASKERAFLDQRLVVVHKELQDSARALSEFSSRNTTFDPDEQSKAMVEATASLQGQLIAAQSELGELQQIYTENNVRVRALKAQVAELQNRINEFGGKNYNGATVLDPNSLYPPLKQLPILGRTYAELYQRAKINEKVFELLTEAAELARVEEAKQTPSVKVLDPPEAPEKKSWPPRTVLTLLGGVMGFALASCWIIGLKRWSETDPEEPYKAFLLQEVLPVLRPKLASAQCRVQRMLGRVRPSAVDSKGNSDGNGAG